MKLAYSTIVNGDNAAYPGRIATVIHVTGGPVKCKYLSIFESQDPSQSEDTSFILNLVARQAEGDGETNAVVFSGVEPLWQGNAVFELCKNLREAGFFVKVESSGFYSNDLRNIASVANFISLDLKHVLHQHAYFDLIENTLNFEVFQSNFLKSLAFLEHGKAFKEVKTIVVPGINNSPESIREMAKLIATTCDQYALCQFLPWPSPLLDTAFEKFKPPTRLELLELAQVARAYVGRVVVRCSESEDQEALPKGEPKQ